MVSSQREHQLGYFVYLDKIRSVLKEILAKKPIRQRTIPGYGWAFVATCAGVPRTLFWSPLMVVAVGGRLYQIPQVSDKVFEDCDGAVGLGPGFPNDSQHLIGRKVQGLVNDHRTVAAPLTACRPNFWPNEPPRLLTTPLPQECQ
jgi:hypothetical protein